MIDEEFDLVLPSGFTTDKDKLVNYMVTLPHVFNLNCKRKWEMALLQMTLPDRGEQGLYDQYWFSISNEYAVTTDKDGKLTTWGVGGFFYERVFLDKDIIKTRDNTLMYYEFKRLFNDRLLDFPDFGYQLKNMLSVSLRDGKVEFEMDDDLKSLGYYKPPSGEKLILTSALYIRFSRPLAYFLGLEGDLSDTLGDNNGSFIKYRKGYKIEDTVRPLQCMDLIIYKKKADGGSLKGAKISCLTRIKDGVHVNPHTAINVKCDLLESNYLGGVDKKRVLRKLSFYDEHLDTYVRYFAPKNIVFAPLEKLQFQQISVKLDDDDDNPINPTFFYSSKQYTGETSITVRIRPII